MTHTRFPLLASPVSSLNMTTAIQTVRNWIERGDQGRMVCFTTVHMIMEGFKNEGFRSLLASMDMNCPDGTPLVWAARLEGDKSISRVCGPEFMPTFCEATLDMKLRHYFYGGAPGVAQQVAMKLKERMPELQVAGVYTPPFGPVDEQLDRQITANINSSEADVVWVCLGCPKQELWMKAHKDKLNAKVLLSVGFAFDVVSGAKKRAPKILQSAGLEWVYRISQEPGRLWKRYLVTNSQFLYHYIRERGLMKQTAVEAVKEVDSTSCTGKLAA